MNVIAQKNSGHPRFAQKLANIHYTRPVANYAIGAQRIIQKIKACSKVGLLSQTLPASNLRICHETQITSETERCIIILNMMYNLLRT